MTNAYRVSIVLIGRNIDTRWDLIGSSISICKSVYWEDCIYSVVDPKSTALFTKQLLDPERCKHKCLVEICFYSVADPNLYLDQKYNYFCLQLPKFDPNQAIWNEKGQACHCEISISQPEGFFLVK